MMKMDYLIRLSLCFLLAISALAYADPEVDKKPFSPSSKIVWDSTQINFVKNGDSKKGEKLNKEKMCSLCHGEKGISSGRNWPNLAGQLANYTFKQLKDYKDISRHNSNPASLMTSLANQLTDKEMADLATYYASLPLPKKQNGKPSLTKQMQNIVSIVKTGDGNRMIPSCLSCHGADAQGTIMDIPALAGQKATYFKITMKQFKTGVRHNDLYSRMRLISKALTDDEIESIAEYFASVYVHD